MPYILNTPIDVKEMLKAIGKRSVEELFRHIPAGIRLGSLPAIEPLSELEVKKALDELAAKNVPLKDYNSFLGAGCYDHYIPAALPFVLSRSEFLTAYTPYQAECSQGALQAIYEYQTYMCLLTGMDVSNASLFDGASAMAEAALMGLRITGRKKILIADTVHPEYARVLKTYVSGTDFTVHTIGHGPDGCINSQSLQSAVDDDTACVVFQSPNFFGLIEEAGEIAACARACGARTVQVTNPLALAILKEPAALGVDIACGDGQALGSGLNFGGPSFGFLATRSEYLRQMPGRIVGRTLDRDQQTAYCLTLQTREQHIRREKATSNICSNQSLSAIGAAVYLALMGSSGVRNAALMSFNNAQYLYQRLRQVRGVKLPYPNRIFNEFLWHTDRVQGVVSALYGKKIIAGLPLAEFYSEHANGVLSCCTEKKTKADMDAFVNTLAEVLHG